jgi:hypothetical protein
MDADRARMRDVLRQAMAANPVSENAVIRRLLHGGRGLEARQPVRTLQPGFGFRFAPALAMLLLFSAVGASYAAEGTVPGQLLYPVKVHVTEPAREALALTPEAKVAWETERLKRRIEEAQILAVRGELTEAHSEMLATQVTQQGARLAQRVEETGVRRDAYALTGASIDATAVITTQGEILATVAGSSMPTGTTATTAEVTRITQAIDGTATALQNLRTNVEEQAGLLPKTDMETAPSDPPKEVVEFTKRRQLRAEQAIADARTALRDNRDRIPELIALQARAMIQRAEEYLHQGETHTEQHQYPLAADWFAKAQTMAGRAKALIEANLILEVEVTLPEETAPEPETETPSTEGSGEGGMGGAESTPPDAPETGE